MKGEYFEGNKSLVLSPDSRPESHAFFIGIIHEGSDADLAKTMESIFRQNYPASQTEVKIFHGIENTPRINFQLAIQLVSFQNERNFFEEFISHVNQSSADYYIAFRSGVCFFDYSLGAVKKIFLEQPQISWLTGIQTIRVSYGFNLIFGSIATRRWSYEIFEHNLYKKSARYIPAGSTFWKRSLWDKALPHLYFVFYKSFCEDIWLGFFKVAQLYTSNIYISSSADYDTKKMGSLSKNVQYSLLEDGFLEKMQEFFFVNNVPYLRLYYRKKNKLVPVVRYDHRNQACFLNDY